MPNNFFLATIILIITSSSFAAPGQKELVVQNLATTLKVTLGEKITIFTISPKSKNQTILFKNNIGQSGSRVISQKDVVYIQRLIDKIKLHKNQSVLKCYRQKIVLSWQGNKFKSCIEKDNPTSKEMLDLANTLSFLF